jgi:hypothetical protein
VDESIQLTSELLAEIAFAGEKRLLEGYWRTDPDAWTEQLRFTQWSVLLEAAGIGGWIPADTWFTCFPWQADADGRGLCATALRQLRRGRALQLRRRGQDIWVRALGQSEAWERWVLRLTSYLTGVWGLTPHH